MRTLRFVASIILKRNNSHPMLVKHLELHLKPCHNTKTQVLLVIYHRLLQQTNQRKSTQPAQQNPSWYHAVLPVNSVKTDLFTKIILPPSLVQGSWQQLVGRDQEDLKHPLRKLQRLQVQSKLKDNRKRRQSMDTIGMGLRTRLSVKWVRPSP